MSITVYSKPRCPQCDATYRKLKKMGVAHESVDVTKDEDSLNLIKGLGYSQAQWGRRYPGDLGRLPPRPHREGRGTRRSLTPTKQRNTPCRHSSRFSPSSPSSSFPPSSATRSVAPLSAAASAPKAAATSPPLPQAAAPTGDPSPPQSAPPPRYAPAGNATYCHQVTQPAG